MPKLSPISPLSKFKRESFQTHSSRFENLEQRNLLSNVPVGIDLSEFIVSSNEYASSYVTQKADYARSIDLRCKSWHNETQFESTPSEDANAQVVLQNFNDDKTSNPDDYVEQIANKICDSTIYPLVFETQDLSEVDGDGASEISIDDEVSSCSTLSGGSGGTGGSSGGNVNNAPSISGGFANSGGAIMMLTSNDGYEFSFIATDDANDSLYLRFSGISIISSTTDISSGVNSNTYNYTVKINISNSGEFTGKFWVVDSHGAASSFIELPLEVIEIRDFYFVEKAAGQTNYTQLSDSHVLWKENINDIRFTTTPTIDYGDSVKVNQFTSLFNYDVKALEWEWNGSNYVKTIAEPTDSDWENFNYSVGVYDCKVNIYTHNRSRLIKTLEPHSQYYCVNEIQDVQWETPEGYNTTNTFLKLNNVGGNSKVFVEQNLNTNTGILSQEKNIISVRVSLAIPIPSNLTATVCVKWFDPNNPIQYEGCPVPTNNGAGKRDNNGTALLNAPVLFFTQGNNCAQSVSVQFTIYGGYAGDNYIIAAHPNDGVLDNATINTSNQIGFFNNTASSGRTSYVLNHVTPILTVWRTLWTELDSMSSTSNEISETTSTPPIDGLVESELARACIQIREYPQTLNINPTLQTTEFAEFSNLNLGRNIPQATSSFWAIRLVGAIHDREDANRLVPKILGKCYHASQTIGIFNRSIKESINYWGTINNNNQLISYYQRTDVIRQVVLHEIGHTLGLNHINLTDNLMNSEHNIGQRLEIQNRSFTNEQIRIIQSHLSLQVP